MKKHPVSPTLVTAVLLVAAAIVLPAADPYLPIEEVRPGMVGIGRTVFEGSKIEEFQAHILGVLTNVIGPRRNLILAKLEGGPLAQTGVIAGMSGSPVYVDGRLVGAVSYSLGQFSKEPIAGITPIGEMIEAAALATKRPQSARVPLELPVTHESLAAAFDRAFARWQPFASRPSDVRFSSVTGLGEQVGTLLRPIATPLLMAGFQPEVGETIAGAFLSHGFLPSGGSAQQTTAPRDTAPRAPLKPGDAVGISLISGDLSLGGTGTVTHVDDKRVYAFGHPFYNLGPTQFPMTRAYVHTLLPSLFTSTKIASTGEVIGTFQQDRATTIVGTLGAGPSLIPITLALENERGGKKTFRFDVVNDQLFTPLMTYVSILNTLGSYERQYGAATFSVKGKVRFKNHGDVAFEDVFTGESPSMGAAAYVTGPITFLIGNDFEPVEIEGLNLTITSTEERRSATIERVWVDAIKPRAGKTVPLRILMKTYRGEEVTRTLPIDLPSNASGALSILVSDGSQLTQWEQREVRQPLRPQGVAQIIRVLNQARKNNRLYVKLLTSEPGAVINGEYLSSLPPSVLAVMEADRHSGNFIPLRNATVGEWELATDHAVRGSRLLTINIDRD